MTDSAASPFRCVLHAWTAYEPELHAYLIAQARDHALADDLLQEVFLKALREGARFCALESPRGWLFQVTRHALIDHHRLRKPTVAVVDTLPAPTTVTEPIDTLSSGLDDALQALSPADREVLQHCDLDGETQRAYAEAHGLGLPAVKARLQRARSRLRRQLVERWDVRLDAGGHVCCHRAAPPADR